MSKDFSGWINFGFLLGLAIVTTMTLPDLSTSFNDDASIETHVVADIKRGPDETSKPLEVPLMVQIASIPKPSLELHRKNKMLRKDDGVASKAEDQNRFEGTIQTLTKTKPVFPNKIKSIANLVVPLSPQPDDPGVKHDAPLQNRLSAVTGGPRLVRPVIKPLKTMNVEGVLPDVSTASVTPIASVSDSITSNDSLSDHQYSEASTNVKRVDDTPFSPANVIDGIKTPQNYRPIKFVVNPSAIDLAKASQQINDRNNLPLLEFLWPVNTSSHQQIYHVLTHCLGMVVGQVNPLGQVSLAPGQGVNTLNQNLHSPLLRLLEKPVTPDEARVVASMDNTSDNGHLIRVFRRDMDVRLLAGLRKLTGGGNHLTGQITSEYLLRNDGLYLDKVTHDGVSLQGQIQLYEGSCV